MPDFQNEHMTSEISLRMQSAFINVFMLPSIMSGSEIPRMGRLPFSQETAEPDEFSPTEPVDYL